MSGYIGPLPVPQGIQRKQSFTATASQTTFNTNGYTDGAFINVYLNGVRLINGTDYTATSDTLTISAGSTTGTIPITVLQDSVYERDETVTMTLSSASNALNGEISP